MHVCVCVCVGARHSLVLQPPASIAHKFVAGMPPSSVSGELHILLHMQRARWLLVREDEKFEEENFSWGKGRAGLQGGVEILKSTHTLTLLMRCNFRLSGTRGENKPLPSLQKAL